MKHFILPDPTLLLTPPKRDACLSLSQRRCPFGAKTKMAARDEENNSSNDNDIEALLQWAAKMGVSDSPPSSSFSYSSSSSSSQSSSSCLGRSLFVSTFPNAGGRGLAAARDLKRGEIVLRVPRAALLTSDSVMRGEKFASCVKRHPYLSSTQILIVCLLAEVGKGRGSQWFPYLVQLPRCYHTLANFSQVETRALQVEDAIWVSDKAVLKSKSDWKRAIALMRELEFKPKFLTLRSWLWASATIFSRTLHISWDDAGCLCPVGDLFNYAAPDEESCSDDLNSSPGALQLNDVTSLKCIGTIEQPDVEQLECYSRRLTDGGYEEDTASYCFYAREKYKKGEQVLLSYGTYTNLELLEHYGFLLDANPNDKVFIQLDIDKHKFSSWPNESLYIQCDGSPSFALLCTLRLWAMPVNLRRSVGHRAYSGCLLSAENELFVMKWLADHCQIILGKLPTAVEEDELLLVTIDNMLEHSSYPKFTESLSLEGEINSFFQDNGLQKEGLADCLLSAKARKSLERWRLAVHWRHNHKKILINCISYCNSVIDSLSSDCALGKRMDHI